MLHELRSCNFISLESQMKVVNILIDNCSYNIIKCSGSGVHSYMHLATIFMHLPVLNCTVHCAKV